MPYKTCLHAFGTAASLYVRSRNGRSCSPASGTAASTSLHNGKDTTQPTEDNTETWQDKSDEELTTMVQHYIDERLSPQTGRVIRMRFDDEKSYKDISHTLGISLSAVNKHIVQGLRKLRQQFNQREV